jgi:uncharacterized protein YjbI with pentapeptide repeats
LKGVLSGDWLDGVDFRGAKLFRTTFSLIVWDDLAPHVPMIQCNADKQSIPRTSMRYADLRGSDFGDSDMRGVLACSIKADDAEFSGTDLSHADLRLAMASSAKFRGADLSWAQLDHADLRNGSFLGADFDRTSLDCADLRGADLTNARHLTTGQLLAAIVDEDAKLPAPLRSVYLESARRDDAKAEECKASHDVLVSAWGR